MLEHLDVVFAEFFEEVYLVGDFAQNLHSGNEKFCKRAVIVFARNLALIEVGLCDLYKLLDAHFLYILSVEPSHLCFVEYTGRFGYTLHVKLLDKLSHTQFFLVALRRPTQKRDIVDDSLGQITFCEKILKVGVAVTLGQFSLRVFHYRR